ncbi:hypothetical protein QVZ43_03730 [Marinobacter sp. chi1]|uniref:Peptidase MA-like domain-containing protein n=1 Tax=Marinobacter suaedae TaxID=3057675 RepID=A0ABT8VXV6_9GAMM|nr:hypothetical protein [Marinobacter sp. chi1]MDO3720819.1 hypothetical protein [Marinobacter sp. chi1]
MNRIIWSVSGALAVSVALSACGGGGSGGSGGGGGGSGGGGGGTDTVELVDGDFKFSSETNKFYQNPDADQQAKDLEEGCFASDYYFESDNFIVFSNLTTHTNEEYRTAASKAQDAMDRVLPQFGMDWDDFRAMKRVVSFSDIGRFALEASQLGLTTDQLSTYFPGIQDGTAAQQQVFIYNALVNEEDSAKVLSDINTFIAENSGGDSSLSEITPIYDKIQICASGNDRIGRSSSSGIKISPDFSNDVYRHEAIHLIIDQVSQYPAFWAKEGQTHTLLGEGAPPVVEDPASISENIINANEAEPEILNKFKYAYLELLTKTGNNLDTIMDWYRQSSNITVEWLAPDGTVAPTEDEIKAGVKAAFGKVMTPLTYSAFFSDL